MAEISARIPRRKDPYGLHVDVLVPLVDGGDAVICAHRKAVLVEGYPLTRGVGAFRTCLFVLA